MEQLALLLLVIGGLNWGLIGLFNLDLVAAIFGPLSTFARIVYVLVGLSAVYVTVARMAHMSIPRRAKPAER
jgi:uncharacterized membrane protein YuzA (DUF378 family)